MVWFYADMRGTREVPIWDKPCPLFYTRTESEIAGWRIRRVRSDEMSRLRCYQVGTRLSFYSGPSEDFPSTRAQEDQILASGFGGGEEVDGPDESMSHAGGPEEDGACKLCGTDFRDYGFLCPTCRGLLVLKRDGEEYVARMHAGDLQLQGFRCIFCGEWLKQGEAMLDHSHETGRIRGYVCRPCNSMNKTWGAQEIPVIRKRRGKRGRWEQRPRRPGPRAAGPARRRRPASPSRTSRPPRTLTPPGTPPRRTRPGCSTPGPAPPVVPPRSRPAASSRRPDPVPSPGTRSAPRAPRGSATSARSLHRHPSEQTLRSD